MKIVKNQIDQNFGYIKIKATTTNTFITLTDVDGNVLLSKHAGILEFKGSKKKTPYVGGEIFKSFLTDIVKLNIKTKAYIIQVNGFIRRSVIYNILSQLFVTDSEKESENVFFLQPIINKTHNGLRKKKRRRL